jgi:hypothetical protein
MTARSGDGERPGLWHVLVSEGKEPSLTEFDWASVRRDPHTVATEHEARAELSLAKLNAVLRARERRRRLVPLVSAALAGLLLPFVTAFTVNRLRHA